MNEGRLAAEEASTVALVASTIDRYDAIHVLDNNAALTDAGALTQDTDVSAIASDVWDRMFASTCAASS